MQTSQKISKLQHIHTIFYKHKFIGIGIVMAVLATTYAISWASISTDFVDNVAPVTVVGPNATDVLVMDLTIPDAWNGGAFSSDILLQSGSSAFWQGQTLNNIPDAGVGNIGGVGFVNVAPPGFQGGGTEAVIIDLDGDKNYTSAADVAIDCDGTATNGADVPASCAVHNAGDTLIPMGVNRLDMDNNGTRDGQPLCTDNLITPVELAVDDDGDCSNGAGGVVLLGTTPASAVITITNAVPANNAWAYADEDGDGWLDNGEDLFIESFANSKTYSAGPDTDVYSIGGLAAGANLRTFDALDCDGAGGPGTQPCKFTGTAPIDAADSIVVDEGTAAGAAPNSIVDKQDDQLIGIGIVNNRTAVDITDISAVKIWADAGAAGFDGAGTDTLLGTMTVHSTDNQKWNIGGLTQAIPAGGQRVFITVDISAAPTDGSSVRFRIPVYNDAGGDGVVAANNDKGVFMASNNDGPTDDGILNATIQTIDAMAPVLTETTPVSTPTNDNTPDYTFNTDEDGTITYGGDCTSTTALAIAGDNTITFDTVLTDGLHNNCTVTVTDTALNSSLPLSVSAFTIDTSGPPVLAEVTPLPSPTNDSTPDYTFSTTKDGTITYGGDCSSATAAATAGNNTVTFNALAEGIHNNCTIIVTDALLNASLALNVNAFSVDTVAPAAITDLASSAQTNTSISLSWTAPGDNNNVGTATSYDLRYAQSPINAGNFAAATAAVGEPLPQVAGTTETYTITGLTDDTLYYFAIITADSAGNLSLISNLPSVSTPATPQITGAGNVNGIGAGACMGSLCIKKDSLKSIIGQSESGKAEPTILPAYFCERSQTTEVTFKDTENDPNRLFIEDLYRKCILNGRNNESFDPEGLVSRSEFLAAVLRKFDLSMSEYQNSYADVQSADWFSGYVATALNEGLINPGTNFAPQNPVKRVEALKIVILALRINDVGDFNASFIDTSSQDWFYHYVAYAQVKKLLDIKEIQAGKVGLVGRFYSFDKDLRQSDNNLDVKYLKKVLKQMGLFIGDINTYYDHELAQAVLNFQSSRGLKVSGNFDFQTRTKLLAEDLSPRTMRYFMPDKYLTRSEMAALLVMIDR